MASIRQDQENAINSLDPMNFLCDKIVPEKVSHRIAQYHVVMEGDQAFLQAHVDIVSDKVEKRIRNRFQSLDTNDKIELLKKMIPFHHLSLYNVDMSTKMLLLTD